MISQISVNAMIEKIIIKLKAKIKQRNLFYNQEKELMKLVDEIKHLKDVNQENERKFDILKEIYTQNKQQLDQQGPSTSATRARRTRCNQTRDLCNKPTMQLVQKTKKWTMEGHSNGKSKSPGKHLLHKRETNSPNAHCNQTHRKSL